MAINRVTRGVPGHNIQIGPVKDALVQNPNAILSVSDYFEPLLFTHPLSQWIPINEIGKSWGYMPFFATKRILDAWALLNLPYIYVGCTAGQHRSPMTVFCWLLSQPGATLDSVAAQFFGTFAEPLIDKYKEDVKDGYIPSDLLEMYQLMNINPNWSYRAITQGMLRYERISYIDASKVSIHG